MRDINRIDKFCNELAEVWKTVPDLRFGQFTSIVFDSMGNRNPFFPEEDEMMKSIQDCFNKDKVK